MPQVQTGKVTIANGASLSDALFLSWAPSAVIFIPAAWTAANLTFQASYDGVTYVDLYDDSGVEVTVTVGGASRAIALTLAKFLGLRQIKIRSGTTGAPVNQGAARDLFIAFAE